MTLDTPITKKIRADKCLQQTKQSGLTIIESLVAISILVIAVLGPLVIVSQALRTSFFARDQLTTYYLAQEVIEHVRNLRDKNSLTKTDAAEWLNGITYMNGSLETSPTVEPVNSSNPKKYRLVRDNGYKLEACPSNDCGKLNVNKTTGVYGELGGQDIKESIYTREVVFYQALGDSSAEQEVTVEVTLKWNQVGGVYQFKLRENILNWKIQKFE